MNRKTRRWRRSSPLSSTRPVRTPLVTAHVQRPADPCRKYESPTDFGRCHLFTRANGWRFIPEIGRNADLDTQLRCAPVRTDLDIYAECIGRSLLLAVASDVDAVQPAAGPGSRAPIRVEPIAPDVAVARPSPAHSSGAREELNAALRTWTPRRVEHTAPAAVVRIVPKAPLAKPEQSTRARRVPENGSCYGDVSSYTGRPKTVHVRAITGRMAPTSAASFGAAH
jgi:hypothetical protein